VINPIERQRARRRMQRRIREVVEQRRLALVTPPGQSPEPDTAAPVDPAA
jgi:hypothetical protein